MTGSYHKPTQKSLLSSTQSGFDKRENQGSVRLQSEYQTTVPKTRVTGSDTKDRAGHDPSKFGVVRGIEEILAKVATRFSTVISKMGSSLVC